MQINCNNTGFEDECLDLPASKTTDRVPCGEKPIRTM